MIYDFGCLGQPDLLPKIVSALPGAVAAFATVAGLAVIGALLNRSARFQAHDIFSGWGLVAAVMTVAAVCFTKALPFVTLVLFLLIAIALIPALKRRIFVSPFWLLALVPGLFILAAINIAGIAKWDDFSHWVPNALYLFQHDGVPGLSMPPARSAWPGYPYALPFLTYMASWLVGGFLVQGGAMINFLLLIAFASMLAEMPAAPVNARPLNLNAIGKTALALLLVTLANPGFNASFTVTSQGDTPTMVLTGVLALLLWRMTNALREKKGRANLDGALTLPVALGAVAFVLIKQSNLVLLALLIFAFLVVAAKNRVLKRALVKIPAMILPALILRFIWQHYVDSEMAGNGFGFHPLGEWRFDLLGPLLQAMAHEMLKKNGLSVLMLAVTGYGIAGFFRPATPLRSFALITGIVYVGYLSFLVAAYIGASFIEAEVLRAASFYRYCTHTALLGISALWMAAPALWKWMKNKTRKLLPPVNPPPLAWMSGICLLVVFLPIVFLVHAEWIVPQPSVPVCITRAFGDEVAQHLPPQSRLAILDAKGNGFEPFIVNFELGVDDLKTGHQSRVVTAPDMSELEKRPAIVETIKTESDINTVLIRHPTDELKRAFNLTGNEPATLLLRKGAKWQKISLPLPDGLP